MFDLYLHKTDVFVWNSEDAANLRRNHRIIGSFIGSLPETPRQCSTSGLPLLLMPEEAWLLVDKSIARVLLCQHPDLEKAAEYYTAYRKKFCFEYNERYKIERRETIIQMADKIISGKLAKKKIDVVNEAVKKEIIDKELAKVVDLPAESCATEIFTRCPIENRSQMTVKLDYPRNENERIRLVVYKDLWERNYYVTSGYKFGCDFLVYEGDPSAFHSRYMILCKAADEKIVDLQLQSLGRLAKSVKKTLLVATVDNCDENKSNQHCKIEYLILNWRDKN